MTFTQNNNQNQQKLSPQIFERKKFSSATPLFTKAKMSLWVGARFSYNPFHVSYLYMNNTVRTLFQEGHAK